MANLGQSKRGIVSSGAVLGGGRGITTPAGNQLILDLYPNAAAAYSVRKLRSDYTGSALRVRRASDNAEQDIGFVGNDLDTASLLTFVGASNGFVSTWYDQSTNAKHMTQVLAASQVQIVFAGVLSEDGGKPSIKGATGKFFDVPTVSIASYLFSVTKNSNTVQYQPLFGDLIVTGLVASNVWDMRKRGDSSVLIIGTATSTNQTVLSFRTIANNCEFWANGISQGTDVTTNAYADATLSLRASGVGDYVGDIQEIICYSTNQDSNRTAIELNINTYYSIY